MSRGTAGACDRTFVVNLPGSVGGVKDGITVLDPILHHIQAQLENARDGVHAPRGRGAVTERPRGGAARDEPSAGQPATEPFRVNAGAAWSRSPGDGSRRSPWTSPPPRPA